MKHLNRFFCFLLITVVGLAGSVGAAPATSAKSAINAEPSVTDVLLGKLLEAHMKRLTLSYLGDARSKAFLDDLLKDLAPQLKKNFKANITGSYRKVLLENFKAAIDETSKDLVKVLAQTPADEAKVIGVMENTPFPMDLAFSQVAKNLAEKKTFQATQAGDQGKGGAPKPDVGRLQALLKKLTGEASKDAYEQVKALYANTPRRDFPIWWYDDAQHEVGYTTHGDDPAAPTTQKRKPWTVLIFLNADNDLEAAGLKDLNEMEKVGSDDGLNIVVQIDRMNGGKGDTLIDANWTGARRYYVIREQTKKIVSPLVMNLGERDMGDRKELAEFLSWGVETYPADHYLAVVWNHGAGWKGISVDDQSGNMLTTPDVLWALAQVKTSLGKVNPKHPKFDVIDFDACLMGMIEVAYEMRDCADFMVASEETEPGEGMPYMDTLSPLRATPGMSPRTLAKEMVAAYVKSYALGGDQTNKRITGSPVTMAAYDLALIAPLAGKLDKLGASLLANHEMYSTLLVDASSQFARIRRYEDDSFVDLLDFCRRLGSLKQLPDETRQLCVDIITMLGNPKLDDHLARPVVIKRRTPGAVIWGYNGWKMPPAELWPPRSAVYHTRFVRTPLQGPDANGNYSCKIGPFALVVDPLKKRKEFVQEINYKIEYESGKVSPDLIDRTGSEYTLVTNFPATSPILIEGHTQGMGNSFGISVYYPYCLDFKTSYKTLLFAKDTQWDEFIATIPKYKAKSDILVTGPMVENAQAIPVVLDTLERLQKHVDVLWDPKVFGYRYSEILGQYLKGLVITDNSAASSFESLAPSADDLIEYLEKGGNLLIAAQSVEQHNYNTRLLEEYFKFKYVDDERNLQDLKYSNAKGVGATFVLNGEDSAQTAGDITIMDCDKPAVPFVALADGRTAGIFTKATSSSGNLYSALFLGFRFEAVTGAEQRSALLGRCLELLKPSLPKPME